MALIANKRNYKEAFRKHYHAFVNWQNTGSEISKMLILTYAVECGLKYIIMERECLYSIKDADDEIMDILYSHNILKLLKQVRWAKYSFINFFTEYDEIVDASNFHEFCRYCIPIKKTDKEREKMKKFCDELTKIAKDLDEEAIR